MYIYNDFDLLFIFIVIYLKYFRANLSQNYFTNRQDRYFVIQDCEPFADYCDDYIKSCKILLIFKKKCELC